MGVGCCIEGIGRGGRAVPALLLLIALGVMPGCAHRHREEPVLRPPFEGSVEEAVWPVLQAMRRVSSGYGEPRGNAAEGGHCHAGVDIPAPQGTPVVAVRSGVVSFSGGQRGYGDTICIAHGDGVETLYGHLSKRLAVRGERVRLGQIIGRVGVSGNATGAHLHFEVRRGGKAVNPAVCLPPF